MNWDDYEATLLALLVYREARGEPFEGQIAVACSVLNRVGRPSWWGDSLSSVIAKKWQYSSMTATGDPQLSLFPFRPNTVFDQVLHAVDMVLSGTAKNPAPGADSYYSVSIPAPKWATPETFVIQIGNHRFYNTDYDHEAEAAS